MTEYYAALAPRAIDPQLVNRARKRAQWWRDMHGPNDLDEEIYDELADALVALAAERKLFMEALTWIDENYENINLSHRHFRVAAKLKTSAALDDGLKSASGTLNTNGESNV